MSQKPAHKTKGTIAAEEIRAKTNHLTDAEREKLVNRARELMNGGGGKGKACAHCP